MMTASLSHQNDHDAVSQRWGRCGKAIGQGARRRGAPSRVLQAHADECDNKTKGAPFREIAG